MCSGHSESAGIIALTPRTLEQRWALSAANWYVNISRSKEGITLIFNFTHFLSLELNISIVGETGS